jgi:DNA-binding transcriptional MerR regulator
LRFKRREEDNAVPDLKIGELARRAGTNPPTVRYYEQIGILPPASRRDGGQRSYGEEDVRRLIFIRRCRDFGFSIEQVRALAALVQDRERSCLEARDLAQVHREAVRARLHELKALEGTIARFVERCEVACAGGPGPDCVVLEDLHQPRALHGDRRRGAESRVGADAEVDD